MGHLFCKTPIDFSSEGCLFIGSGRNISRLDLNIEQHIQKQVDNALGLMWFATDFSYAEDAKDYSSMDKKLQDLFLKNLKFQTLLDSVAARSVVEVFLPITTNPQLETWWLQHGFFEGCVHSKTYAEIIKALPVNAKDIFDDIMINKEILNRAKDIMRYFEHTVKMNSRMLLKDEVQYDIEEHKKSIVLSLFALNILEAVLFKSSFITSFAYKENGIMNSTGDSIKKISLDETGHFAMTVNILNRYRVDPEWAYIFKLLEPEIIAMYKNAIEADYIWIDYLFEDDPILLGVSSEVLKQYVDYNAKIVMTSVQLEPLSDDVFNPCTWANKYNKSSNVQTAMKEKNSANYLLGRLNTEVSSEFWESLDYANR